MKYILFFISLLLPYLASAQVAKDTVTVLTPAQITAASPNDTANIYFVIANAWRKANFDSIARYTRNRFQTLTLDSTHIAANGISLQGTELTGTLPVSKGGTGNQTGLAATATALATGRTIQTNLASTSSATFDGTANITPGVTGTLPVGNGGTGTDAQFTQGSVVFAGAGGVYSQNNSGLFWDNANGRLGIVTTSPASVLNVLSTKTTALSTAADFLTLGATIDDNTNYANLGIGGGIAFRAKRNTAGTQTVYGAIDAAKETALGDEYRGSLRFWTNQNSTGIPLERMRITSGGNVGIGTISPAYKLDVNGSISNNSAQNIIYSSYDDVAALFQRVGAYGAVIRLGRSGVSNSTTIDYPNNGALAISTSGSERMRITSGGNVGIGTVPAVQFHTTGGVRFATFAGGGTTTLSVDNAGDLLRTSTVEYKKDIEPIRYGLKEVMDLQPVNFNWIDEDRFGNVNENGFIAEDVMNVLPNVANADGNGVFMDYTKLIAVLTKAIQEQQQQIEQLKQRITQLENK